MRILIIKSLGVVALSAIFATGSMADQHETKSLDPGLFPMPKQVLATVLPCDDESSQSCVMKVCIELADNTHACCEIKSEYITPGKPTHPKVSE